MTTKTMTLMQALIEIKHLSKNGIIANAINKPFIRSIKGGSKIIGSLNTVEAERPLLESNLDKAEAALQRLWTLRSKVAEVNATTKIKIKGQEMTITQALALTSNASGESVLGLKKILLGNLKFQYGQVVNAVALSQADISRAREKYMEEQQKATVKLAPEIVLAAFNESQKANEVTVLDPKNLAKYIEKLEQEIQEYTQELDSVLAVANATTTFEV